MRVGGVLIKCSVEMKMGKSQFFYFETNRYYSKTNFKRIVSEIIIFKNPRMTKLEK